MRHRIARFAFSPLTLLLRLLLPGTGRRRRRRTAGVPAAACTCPCTCAQTDAATEYRTGDRPLRGEDHVMIRPYLVAHERQEEAARQRARRRALWFAVHGVDLGPRVIHGMEVA
ncbi:hypothetical protein ACFV6E_13145 [Streptomyces sp. NPDC059785]|uniref:hypothetical protein n=1 Tax=unclassified Streptomyces TaxID=2593676 RepID=UPI00364E90AE